MIGQAHIAETEAQGMDLFLAVLGPGDRLVVGDQANARALQFAASGALSVQTSVCGVEYGTETCNRERCELMPLRCGRTPW